MAAISRAVEATKVPNGGTPGRCEPAKLHANDERNIRVTLIGKGTCVCRATDNQHAPTNRLKNTGGNQREEAMLRLMRLKTAVVTCRPRRHLR